MRLRKITRGPIRWGIVCSFILTGLVIYYIHYQHSEGASQKVSRRNAVRGRGFAREGNSGGTLGYEIRDLLAGLDRLSQALKMCEQKSVKPVNGDPSNPNTEMNGHYAANSKERGGQRTSTTGDTRKNTSIHGTKHPTHRGTTSNTDIPRVTWRDRNDRKNYNETTRPRKLEETFGDRFLHKENLKHRNVEPISRATNTKPQKPFEDRTTEASRKATAISEKEERNTLKLSAVSQGSQFLPTVHLKPPSDPNSPGENGVAVYLTNLTEAQENLRNELLEKYGLDELLSQQISLHRTLPYSRPESCKMQTFVPDLPSVSVIVVFHNEAMSVLKRTLHSLLDNTPDSLLQEILLVDDFSNNDDLKGYLEDYISQLPRIRLLRNRQREGLARSRIRAAGVASGDVLVFLDSHVECNTGWLEPLVDRIARDRKTVVSPGIDWIHGDTFRYDYGIDTLRVTWSWSLGFGFDHEHALKWVELPVEEQVKPVRTPMLLGGLFAIDRQFFREIGMYDPGFEYWGGEHFEISFKAWMCGGSIEVLPCSRVGHVWGKKTYSTGNMTLHYWAQRNNMRVAEVWMDHYKVHFYIRHPNLMKREFGDVSERRLLRERLQCHDFRWYLDHAFPDLYIPDAIPGQYGQVRNNGTDTCLDWASRLNRELKMFPCHHGLNTQFFELTGQKLLRDERACVQAGEDGTGVVLMPCGRYRSEGDLPPLQQWEFTQGGFLYNAVSKKCLHAVPADTGAAGNVTMMPCDLSSLQKWNIEYIWHKDLG